ncbi:MULTISPECIES: carboxypeptidase regulatory-like domain-containing protein [unclassified Sphingomonas]|uniref:TonB-dependent receptor n=1 Tax=unclassified Sphingomonas TaxID=196159 RepID=UPI00286212F3|nr:MULTISPECIES: carboxypeptidase regulatory-like domain-containing protein [unclassified Sphingomonas]MDR6114727.1 hypothetical protein [Sphingomonas sp. SORGH_AS_0789]MDR6151600.1 hypothetical protein [Sphingomonas sp. SORGH_AS_0742]
MRILGTASALVIAMCCSSTVGAQEITASVRGNVTANGAPVAGATVKVVHVPSGTVSTVTTSADGSYGASGLRVGGPFTVTITAPGFQELRVTDLQLVASQPLALPIELDVGEEVVVTGTKVKGVNLGGGPSTVLDRQAIQGVASVNRDIRDIVRRDPFATIDPGQGRGVMIAGQNARLNKFSVDGQRFSDNFGLNVGGLPTARGPVPIDAIEQMSVKIAPYDITEGDFQGGAVNVILRSGTNQFHGSGFYAYSSDGLTGSHTSPGIANRTGDIALDFESRNYGGFLSGPIIKDKLFLAVSYEHLREGTPIAIGTAGFPNVVPNLSDAQIANVQSIAKSVYNYDTLGVQRTTVETDEKWTVKADWNIVDGQRLSATWIHNNSSNASTAGFSSTNPASPALGLQSNNFLRPEKVDSYVAQLNSDWSSNFHTELRGNFRKYDLDPVPFGEFNFAQMQVCLDPVSAVTSTTTNSNATLCSQGSSASPGTARLYFGPDQFRHFNYVHTKQYGTDLVVRWNYADFTMKLNAGWQHLDVGNAFTQNALGNYYFDSIPDFQAGRASSVTLAGSITGNLIDTLASFKYDQYTFGGQVAWDPDATLNITAGARTDLYGGIARPALNSFFTQRYGFTNTSVIDGKMIVQPRLQASWTPAPRLRLKTGFGLFAGGSPDVFLGNSYSVSGVFANSVTITRNLNGVGCQGNISTALCSAALDNVNGRTFSSQLTDYIRSNTGSLSVANVNAMDPKFQMSSTWKASFSADYSPDFGGFLGTGWNIGGDLYYGWVNYAPQYYDLRLRAIGTAPDGRPRYATLTSTSANTDLLLTNTRQGHSLVAVARLDKSFDFGLSVGASYTFQDIKDVSAMNSTTASQTYGQTAMIDPNRAAYGTSIYQIRNSTKLHIDFDHAFYGDYKTRFSLFGERRSGLPYSLTMNDSVQTLSHGNVFGVAGLSSRFLLYVPNVSSITADPLVSYDSATTFTALQTFVQANKLKQGAIIGKNSMRAPQWTKIDIHVDQEVPLPFVRTGRFKLYADVENVLNLLNRDWGALRQVSFPYLASVVNVSCATTSGSNCTQYRYSNFSNPVVDNLGRPSLYAIRVGAKIEF